MFFSGETFSHYRIMASVGAGGMGEVYQAYDTRLDRQVALKILLAEVAEDRDRIQRFVQEAKAVSALNHPNILTVFEIGEFNGRHFMATEFIDGETLRDRVNSDEPMRLRETLEIVIQAAAALGAAHELGIIHRDIKPENIMIREDGLVKVLDFGLAKVTGTPSESVDTTLPQFNTQPGMLVGTIAYMSPEQARGRKLDPRSDIFSLGIVMFELFTGQRPFDGEGHMDIISSIIKDEAPPLRQFVRDAPEALDRIVEKSLRKERDTRYQDVRDLYIDIEDLRDDLKFEAKLHKTVHPTVIGDAQLTNPSDLRSAFRTGISKTRRFTLLHAMIFLAIAAAIVGGVFYFWSGNRSAPPGSYKTTEISSWNSGAGELDLDAKFSPDGKLIAFASTKNGGKNIWVTQTGSTQARQITDDSYENTQPIWSPKGDEIAYLADAVSTDQNSRSATVWRINALGGTPRLIGQLPSRGAQLCRWVQSGKIYYELGRKLYALDVSNGESRVAFDREVNGLIGFDISSDEKTVTYLANEGGSWALSSIGTNETSPSEILRSSITIRSFIVSPERKQVFYSALKDGVFQIFSARLGSSKASQITLSETDVGVADVSANGKSLITTSAKEDSNIWRVSVADGQETLLARDINVKIWPAVSPDNSRIVFQSSRNIGAGRHLLDCQIAIKSAQKKDDGEKPTVVTDAGFLPGWSRDGNSIFYEKEVDQKMALFVGSQNGGGERRLSTLQLQTTGFTTSPYNIPQTVGYSLSPDGSMIAYVMLSDGIQNIGIVNVTNGAESVLTQNTEKKVGMGSPFWSPDGTRLAITVQSPGKNPGDKSQRRIEVIDLATRSLTDIGDSPAVKRLLGWSTDNNAVFVAEVNSLTATPTDVNVSRISIHDDKKISIADLKNVYLLNIFLSDDQKFIAYAARNDDKDDLWVIPAAGGQSRKVTSNNDPGVYYSRLAWFHDGSAIVFGKQSRFSLLSMVSDVE